MYLYNLLIDKTHTSWSPGLCQMHCPIASGVIDAPVQTVKSVILLCMKYHYSSLLYIFTLHTDMNTFYTFACLIRVAESYFLNHRILTNIFSTQVSPLF
jgi:hypothetical protein